MKLETTYENFIPSLMHFIEDKNPVLGYNDSKLISYFLSIRNTNKGFDYYELVKEGNSGVYFRISTTLGFKRIVETSTDVFDEDLSIYEWQDLILQVASIHFAKEEYTALSKGYVKNSNGGCFSSIALILFIALILNLCI